MRIQPSEAVYLKLNAKTPGLYTRALPIEMDLTYKRWSDGVARWTGMNSDRCLAPTPPLPGPPRTVSPSRGPCAGGVRDYLRVLIYYPTA